MEVLEKNSEILTWVRSSNSRNMKGNNKFECKSKSGSQFIRNDIPPALNYQLFLTKEDHEKVLSELGYKGFQWTFHESSVVHFYGGHYIWSSGNDFFIAVKKVLNMKTIW